MHILRLHVDEEQKEGGLAGSRSHTEDNKIPETKKRYWFASALLRNSHALDPIVQYRKCIRKPFEESNKAEKIEYSTVSASHNFLKDQHFRSPDYYRVFNLKGSLEKQLIGVVLSYVSLWVALIHASFEILLTSTYYRCVSAYLMMNSASFK